MRMKLRSGAAAVLAVTLAAAGAGNVSADHVDQEIRDLLQEVITRAKQGQRDGLLKGYERAYITRAARHAIRDVDAYERRMHQGREAAARMHLESYHRNLDAIDVALDEILARRPGREELVAKIRALLKRVREHSPKPVLTEVVHADGFVREVVTSSNCDTGQGWAVESLAGGDLLSSKVSSEIIVLEFDLSRLANAQDIQLQFYVTEATKSPTYVSGTYVIYANTGDGVITPSDCSNNGGIQVFEDNATTEGVQLDLNAISENPNPVAGLRTLTDVVRAIQAQGSQYIRFTIWNFDMKVHSKQGAERNGTVAPRLLYRPSPSSVPPLNCSSAVGGATIVEDNFNGYANGSIVGQDGWVSYVNGDHFVVQGATVFEGAKAVHNNSLGDSVAGRYGTPRADGKQSVCFRTENRDNWGFYSADGNVGVRVSDVFNGTIFASVSLKKDGHVAYYDPLADVYSDFATYNDNEWTLLEIEWRSSDKRARYSANNGAWTDWKTFRGASSFTNFSFVHFGFVLPSGSGGVYFDTLH